jgi:2-iminobutanoate/2-iminopropanoate deaminase
MEIINTSKAPKAVWPYSQAIKVWDFLYSSGQIWIDPNKWKMVEWWAEKQVTQVCKNLWEVLKQAWLDYKNVVKTTIFLDNMSDFPIINEIYWIYFSHLPARSTVEVSKLPLWALVEIEVIASFNN